MTVPCSTDVCALGALVPERGAAALVDGAQVALFRLADDTVLAVQNKDPFSGANVLSRGIVGSAGDAPTLTSPMHKQVWDLRTGSCLDDAGKAPHADGPDLRTWRVTVAGSRVLVASR
ncbi:nitrite reductase small subunit NirD [Cellulomonas edaphi]|uniref:Nitrite reductase small subunit NirD n=1 Tax=Cellulomonas edaphi TaxID=3053468 RepID=A0ABT7SAV6_9CELL|nr:nitrite reductase small subunit NirD [Cellulomons edaphi]MDM7832644.1 nitrite reductase small subunit NirD [Cellulomons edaphi]